VKLSTTLRLCFILIASQLLVGCGSTGNFNTSASPNTAALNGNWLLEGNNQLSQYPFLSLALIVDGSQITANGEMTVPCSNSPGSFVGGGFELIGVVNSDGSFHLSEFNLPGLLGSSSIQLAIDGSAPASGSSTWTGTYSFTDLAGYTYCIVNLTAPFTATGLAPLNATYAGTLTGTSGNVNVSSTIAQGAGISLPGPLGTIDSYLPLTATITVSGSPCFTHGTSNGSADNQIGGDFALVDFTMDDGSQVLLESWLSTPDESKIYPATLVAIGGNCNQNSYAGTLTRQ
jgi:hypothetical protein